MLLKLSSYLLFFIVKIFSLTYKIIELNPEKRKSVSEMSANGNFVYALWHQNIASAMFSEMNRGFACIVSASKDGDFLAHTLELLGHRAARGSSSRGGKQAMNELIRLMNEEKRNGANALDGPRGPARVPKRGIFKIAKETNSPILPCLNIPSSYWQFKSWDKFRFPKPFSRIYVFYCEEITVKSELNSEVLEKLTQQLINNLNDGEQKVIEILGEA